MKVSNFATSSLFLIGFCILPVWGIIGGYRISIEEANYHISILRGDNKVCGGAIIGKHTILTAAHCLEAKGFNAKDYTISAGSIYADKGDMYPVEEQFIHPKRDKNGYDIAMLITKDPINFTKKVGLVKLPKFNQKLPVGRMALISGWGWQKEEAYEVPRIFAAVRVPIWKKENCVKKLGERPEIFCTGSLKGGRSACSGDSGGPIVYDDILVGVISSGGGAACGRAEHVGIQVNVAAVKDWIDEHIK